ncbi:unnamed protein product [Cuscuta europaea]|uniref:Uncharacterized protein n=1 Tax=Cuscuta europaea TaxID=41803 RepID=A0A9P0ZXR5_CUSEU|nr:unnamed protein product [Cuscuta europaea]
MAIPQTVTVLEQIPVSPPPEATAEMSLPLTFLDVVWLTLPPVHRLIFYPHPVSRTGFLDSIIPKMRKSLSQTLQHYTSLAGRVVTSPDNAIVPEIRYAEGDTVPLIIAEFNSGESNNFNNLVSDQARSSMDYQPLIPRLPPTSRAPNGSVVVPVFALQVTLFPDVGFCIGVTNHHIIGDGSSIFGFMKAWSGLCFSSHGDSKKDNTSSQCVPFYGNVEVKDGQRLTKLYWDILKNISIEETHNVNRRPLITNKVRSTFVVTRDDIQRLKNRVLALRSDLVHVSSFTMICSHIWSCLVRSRNEIGENDVEDEEDEHFLCPADCRARLDPPVQGNYFGNCVVPCLGRAMTKELIGEEGFIKAAEVIGESIRGQLYNKEKDGVLRGADSWLTVISGFNFGRTMSLAGSPKFDYYELDFGWGKPKKFDIPSIDVTGAISLGAAKDHEGGLEVGLALPVAQMHIFTNIFKEGLKAL